MKTKVKALQQFVHGKDEFFANQEHEFGKHEAEDLQKAGLVEIVGEAQTEQETKMAEAPENKMADAPANKSRSKKAD